MTCPLSSPAHLSDHVLHESVVEACDALFFREFADEQCAVFLCHDISVESLHHNLFAVSGVYNAVVGVYHTYVFADASVSVHIVRCLLQQRPPCSEVAPSEVGRYDVNLLCFLHDGVIDRDALAFGIYGIDAFLLCRCPIDVFHIFEDAVDGWGIHTECVDDCGDVPDEDAGVPEEVVLPDILFCRLKVGFLPEGIDDKELFVSCGACREVCCIYPYPVSGRVGFMPSVMMASLSPVVFSADFMTRRNSMTSVTIWSLGVTTMFALGSFFFILQLT